MTRIDDGDLVRREYASLDRLARRRLDVTGWVRGLDQFDTFPEVIAEVRPRRVLDAGSGRGDYAAVIPDPEVVCADPSEAAVEAARERGLEARVVEREDLQANLDSYSELLGPLEAPVDPYPFSARRDNCLLVADRAATRGSIDTPS